MPPILDKFNPATISNFDQIYHSVFPEIKNPNGVFNDQAQWYGIFKDGILTAFVTIGLIDPIRAFIYNVGVIKSYRHQGYGRQLIMDLQHDFLKGYDLYLFVRKNNRVAINLYRQCGFTTCPNAFIPPKDEICMSFSKP